jgi:hypothetical protein
MEHLREIEELRAEINALTALKEVVDDIILGKKQQIMVKELSNFGLEKDEKIPITTEYREWGMNTEPILYEKQAVAVVVEGTKFYKNNIYVTCIQINKYNGEMMRLNVPLQLLREMKDAISTR